MKRQCTHTKFALNPPDEFSNLFYARIFFEISVFWSYTLYHYSKALAKRTCKLSQVDASWTCVETCVGWPNGSQASSQVHASRKKKDILRQTILYFIANNRLMDVTQLALTWVGWAIGEKLALTCVQIWSRTKWAQVIASQRKCSQALAKRSRKLTQVFNLRQLASPFGQGLTWLWGFRVKIITF